MLANPNNLFLIMFGNGFQEDLLHHLTKIEVNLGGLQFPLSSSPC